MKFSALISLCLAASSMAAVAAPVQMTNSEMSSVVAGAKYTYDATVKGDPVAINKNWETVTTTTISYTCSGGSVNSCGNTSTTAEVTTTTERIRK